MERPGPFVCLHLKGWLEGDRVESEGSYVISKIGFRDRVVQFPVGHFLRHSRVENVFPGTDIPGGIAEGQAPGKQRLSLSDALESKAVANQNGRAKVQRPIVLRQSGSGFQTTGSDRTIVAGQRNPRGFLETERRCHS